METPFFTLALAFSLFILLYILRIKKAQNQNAVQIPQNSEVFEESKHHSNVHAKELPAEVFPLQTYQIKYNVYNKYFLHSCSSQRIYEQIIFENIWFDEPFYSSFFRIILLLDQNELFMVDPHSRVITSKLRTKTENVISIKSYQIIRIQQLAYSVLKEVQSDIIKFKKKDAQNLTIAICIYIIQQAKIFEDWKLEHLLNLLLEKYNDRKNVQEILLLLDTNDEQLLFVNLSLKNAIRNIHREPYVDKGKLDKIQLPSKLPQKQLLHISNSV